jgi:UDP-N-acetylmuramoyl-L-alanyl-D-glutamate--2,6-diaminopimelate ligase
MIHAILEAAGWDAAAMSTVDLRFGAATEANDSRQTTLEAPEIQAFLARARDAGLRAAVLETSSHGLALHRVDACDYDLAVFTNITHEHLDFHGTFEAYRQAKASLIDLTAESVRKRVAKTAVLNRDDPSYAFLAQRPIERRLSYGIELPAEVQGKRVAQTAAALEVDASTPLGDLSLKLPLFGRWNALNALAAASAAIALDVSLDAIVRGLGSFPGVKGRMERVDLGQPFNVVIDYAHTPQSLEKVLRELRPLTTGRLIAVFGSAGERDREKRRWMGEIAARLADRAVFTDEDPRQEDPAAILEEIASGAEAVGWRRGEQFDCLPDRREGIARAIAEARDGDTVVLAGKGHEQSIIVGREKRPWDERQAALDALRSRR